MSDDQATAERLRRRPEAHDGVRGWAAVLTIAFLALVVVFVLSGRTAEQWVDHPGPKAESLRWRISVTLADVSVIVLGATLAIGPIRVLSGRRPAIHLAVRRRLGVTAAGLGLAHVGFGLAVHGSWSIPHRSFVTGMPSLADPFPIPITYFFLANWIGLLVALALAGLWAISNHASIRRWGARRWKSAQRVIYLLGLALVAHVLLYQQVEQREPVHRILVLSIISSVVLLQAAGAVAVRRRRTATPESRHGRAL